MCKIEYAEGGAKLHPPQDRVKHYKMHALHFPHCFARVLKIYGAKLEQSQRLEVTVVN